MIRKYLVGAICGVLLLGCAVGPDYVTPSTKQMNIPTAWHNTLPHNGSNTELVNWWAQYQDDNMLFFIESALSTNPNIYQAMAKVKQSQASLQYSRSSLFPDLVGSGSYTATSGSSLVTTNGSSSDYSTTTGSSSGTSTSSSGGLSSSWEIDLFGANRRGVEASLARYQASKSDLNDAKLSLVAEVADVYVSTRECQNLLQIYESEVISRSATESLTNLRVKSGFSAPSDLSQARGSLYQNNSNHEQQKNVCEQYYNQFVALTGVSYSDVSTRLNESYGVIPSPQLSYVNSIPAQIINQRPDVSSAERSLAAANADFGQATANRYPQVSLSGSITLNSGYSTLSQATSWSIGPSISLPIFDAGALKSKQALAYAKYQEAYATYRLTVTTAVKEVENALAGVRYSETRLTMAQLATDNYSTYFDAYNQKYTMGWINLLDLETARVTVLSSKETLTSAKLSQVEAWITLYKAVGGGWNNESESSIVVSN